MTQTDKTDTLMIGAGQAELAISHYLSRLGQEHLVLEKDRIPKAWRDERWDSFTLVTPNCMLRLPGMAYDGDDPDGFLKRDEVVEYVRGFAESFAPPSKRASKSRRWRGLPDRPTSSSGARRGSTRPPTWWWRRVRFSD